ncbi:Na+/H+ antiporter subunit E [Cellulomonas iranensis]|uniref:Multicomponent Na+:H+ antiporter subunit E n=1 Tax=Cellulomonas iranensis TaxID=76862 RepID=A0ABU0GJU9_9CELL|nr:Na+/H+ antiporter subunit E [Cellulomonas iranensis]MDQ0425644.1 multicomponent Na+:H+ antiporter subunit E [Cellulomonas iranensis]
MILRALTLPIRAVVFLLWFAGQVVLSSAAVLADVLVSGRRSTPRVVRLDLADAGDHHVTALGVLVTLTPGTLVLGVVEQPGGTRSVLVHSMYHRDETTAVADLRDLDDRLVRGLTLGGRP